VADLEARSKLLHGKPLRYRFDERIPGLKTVQRGWLNYFRLASMWGKLRDVDGWVRNRLAVLHLAGLEETRTETEEPDPFGS
jgi:hypothetical protein